MSWTTCRRWLAWLPVLLLTLPNTASAAWVSFTAAFDPGSGFEVAIPDGTGSVTSTITVTGQPLLPATGANIRIRLIGLTHSWAGDLEITVQNVLNGITETVFSRICNPPETAGCASNFETPLTPYIFQAGGSYNLWTMAQPPFAGGSDRIQSEEDFLDGNGDFVPRIFAGSNSGSDADNNLFISLNGLDPNGEWIIHVRDLAADETGTILGWGVDIWVNEVPEPASAALAMAGLGSFWILRRRRR